MKLLSPLALISVFAFNSAHASETGKHFPSVESNNLSSALCNLHNYNAKLAEITSKAELSALDMVKVHELTYTLENALTQIQKDLVVIAEDLEKVHKASEALNPDVIKQFSNKYLVKTTELVQQSNCR